MEQPRSILVVDDHPLMLDAIAQLMRSVAPGANVASVSNLQAAIARLSADPHDLIVLDLQLHDAVGLSGLSTLRKRFPNTPVVVCSASTDSHTVLQAIDGGACGFIPKTYAGGEFRAAIAAVLDGHVYLPAIAVHDVASPESMLRTTLPIRPLSALQLTPRQVEVLGRLLVADSNKLIGRRFGIAEGTVKAHVSAVLERLGARNRTEAVLIVSQLGWESIVAMYGPSRGVAERRDLPTGPDSRHAREQDPG